MNTLLDNINYRVTSEHKRPAGRGAHVVLPFRNYLNGLNPNKGQSLQVQFLMSSCVPASYSPF